MNSPQELCTGSAAGVLKWSIEPTAVRVPCSWRRSLGNISDKRIAALHTTPYADYFSSGLGYQILSLACVLRVMVAILDIAIGKSNDFSLSSTKGKMITSNLIR